jgi:hypothetical protein
VAAEGKRGRAPGEGGGTGIGERGAAAGAPGSDGGPCGVPAGTGGSPERGGLSPGEGREASSAVRQRQLPYATPATAATVTTTTLALIPPPSRAPRLPDPFRGIFPHFLLRSERWVRFPVDSFLAMDRRENGAAR